MEILANCPCGATTHETVAAHAPPGKVPCWVRCWTCGRLNPARRFVWPSGFRILAEAPSLLVARSEPDEEDTEVTQRRVHRGLANAMGLIQWLDSRCAAEEVEDVLAVIERAVRLVRKKPRGAASELRSSLRDLERVEELLQSAMTRGEPGSEEPTNGAAARGRSDRISPEGRSPWSPERASASTLAGTSPTSRWKVR